MLCPDKQQVAILNTALFRKLNHDQTAWYNEAITVLKNVASQPTSLANEWATLSARAGRKLDKQRLNKQSSDKQSSDKHRLNEQRLNEQKKDELTASVNQQQWDGVALARLLLFIEAIYLCPDNQRLALANQCFRFADDNEKISLVKGLTVYDPAGTLTEQVIHLCRTNNTQLFAAIALNNAWPARHFSEKAFNQLILKSLFMALDIAQVVNLATRHTSNLSTLAMDLLKERQAANRPPPPSIELAINTGHLNESDAALISNISTRGSSK